MEKERNMIMCKLGVYSYIAETPEKAYYAYLDSEDDHDIKTPCDLEWYKVSEMKLTMTLEPREKAASKAQKKSPKKYLAMV